MTARREGRRRWTRLERIGFAIALPVLAGTLLGLSARHHQRWDWTEARSNSLSEPSQRTLRALHGPVTVTVAAADQSLMRAHAQDLVARYRAHNPELTLEIIDPRRSPARAAALGLRGETVLAVSYEGRIEQARDLSERALTHALYRVAQSSARWVVSLDGHGERSLSGRANHDLGLLGGQLAARGFAARGLRLVETGAIPGNTTVLVISTPAVALLPAEREIVLGYLAGGGNLLWLTEPQPDPEGRPLEFLAEALGVRVSAGTVVHPKAGPFGRLAPTVTLVSRYPAHPLTAGFRLLTVLPGAAVLEAMDSSGGWSGSPLLLGPDDSWLEERPDENRPPPPSARRETLVLGLSLERPRPGASEATGARQRVIVIGDGDFLSNAYLGNQGNLDLGLRIIGWLGNEDAAVDVPAPLAVDRTLGLEGRSLQALALGAVLGVPLALLGVGLGVWLRRRRR